MIDTLIAILHQKGLIHNEEYFKINESTNHDVYATENIVLKIDQSRDQLYKEYLILQKTHPIVICPSPLFFIDVTVDKITYYVLGLRKIAGKPVNYVRGGLTHDQKGKIVSDILDQIQLIHTVRMEDIYPNDSSISMLYGSYLLEKYDTSILKAQKNPYIDLINIDRFCDLFHLLYKQCLLEKNNSLIHNDIWYKNVLLGDAGEFMGIIDFEEALLGPIYVEYFRVCDHLLFAKNYIETGGEEYTEIEFLELLIAGFETTYQQAVREITSPERILYSLSTYIKLLSNYDMERYDHKETERYREYYLESIVNTELLG